MVSGEAGIGKSRLLAEAGTRMAARGWPVLDVHADRLERRVLYAALVAALRAVRVDSTYTEGLRREAVAALDLAVPAAFGQACGAVTRLFTALAATGPLAITVDDLHELDDDSLALLAVVLRRLSSAPIGLVVALRPHLAAPNAAAEEMLDRLADEVEVVRVELGTLSPEELAAVIAPVLGAEPDKDLVAEVHRRADGNPFFAAEIARSLAESGLLAVEAGHAHLTVAPQAVRLTRRNAVLRRVVPLADQARAFDDLVRAHVVTADAPDGYRFFHDIVADALYDEIGPAECRRLHRMIAERLLADRARGEAVDPLELAWHVSESAVPGDPVAVSVLTEAAHRALTGAPEAAANFCARALSLLHDDADERPGLLALRCRALARASRPADAVGPGRTALDLLPPGEDRFRTATAVISSLFLLGRVDEAIAVVDGQIAAGPAPATLHAQRAVMLVFAGRTAEARDEARVAAAAVPASPAEDVVVCGQLAMLTSMLGRHAETIEFADRALRASGTSTTLQLQALAVCASTEALAGLVSEATWRLRRAEQLAEETGTAHAFPGELGLTRVVLDYLGGRWDGALEGLRTVAAELETREQATLAAALTAVELEIRTWRGELVLAARLAARPAPTMRNMADLHAHAVAGYLAASGDVPAAVRVLRDALTDPSTAPYGCLLLARLIELAPDPALLSTLVEIASPRVSPWSKTTLHRTVGVARADRASLVAAVNSAEAGGLVFERARAQLALGELAGDAAPGLIEAYRTFARLGAHGLRRRAGRRLHELGEKVPRSRSRASGLLTESEERVARLVQQGMRNREIATALHYSPRSIEVYLSRIYAKLRVSSRLELARALDAMDAVS
ncbi:MAG: hypothetical protein AUI14_16975 [Actinobacteria bacterium 13_2_20CM_2_71_6]|nr:MAG: hypothetical protein AUI14_16975 [Actinobacteria bacterium 13_2_20CM_2_71_6]